MTTQGWLANLASCCVDEKYVPVPTSCNNCVSCAFERNALDAAMAGVDLQGWLAKLVSCCVDAKYVPVAAAGHNCVSSAVERNAFDTEWAGLDPHRALRIGGVWVDMLAQTLGIIPPVTTEG